jgi:hypothetical protein
MKNEVSTKRDVTQWEQVRDREQIPKENLY